MPYTLPAGAQQGFTNAAAYDTHRPSYPAEAVEALLHIMHLTDNAHARILELGAGTGKFTGLLAARHEGFEIVAVEPHADMRAKLLEKLQAPAQATQLERVRIVDGHAGSVPLKDESMDGCVVAQAFHWFATAETLHEVQRVLKPNAVLGMIWNIEDYNKPAAWSATTDWEAKLNSLIISFSKPDGVPRFRDAQWKRVFDAQLASSPFQALRDSLMDNLPRFSLPLGEDRVSWSTWLAPEALWDRVNTLSHIAVLGEPEKAQFRKAFDEALSMADVERDSEARVLCHGVTYFAWCDRI